MGFEFDGVLRPDGAREVLATDFGRYRKQAPVFDEIARFLGEDCSPATVSRGGATGGSSSRSSPASG
jgi:hypothetical protein